MERQGGHRSRFEQVVAGAAPAVGRGRVCVWSNKTGRNYPGWGLVPVLHLELEKARGWLAGMAGT